MSPRGRRRHEEEEKKESEAPREEGSAFSELEDVYSDMRQQFCSVFSLPEEFTTHIRAARREFLLAVRSLIDARIAAMEEGDRRRKATRHTRVQID